MTAIESLAAEHARVRTDLIALLRERGTDAVADLPVPATPDWTVRQAVSHLAGVATDILAGNLEGVASEAWTGAQVAARADHTLDAVLEEWERTDPQVEAIADSFGPMEAQWLMDCVTHATDVRGAIGAEPERRAEALVPAVAFLVDGYRAVNRSANRPLAAFRAGDHEFLVDDGDVRATADVDLFELLRGLTGRRSLDQVRAWAWDVDPEPVLAGFTWAVFTPRPAPLDV